MSLIIATGSNLGDRLSNLNFAKEKLTEHFELIACSEIFESIAVDYLNQPDFYNQVLEFQLPKNKSPQQTLELLLAIETGFGRVRTIDKGPRTIDIDIIFWGLENIVADNLCVPHKSWQERSFVVRPLQQLPFFQTLQKCFKIPRNFTVEASPIKLK
jgi:2-amino-4-hydroxy-6-hydroxymethyldihydropteridine diphosphokinase